jgi:hypothetical protein
LLLEDETHVGKRMRWDVQSNVFEVADQIPLSCLSQSGRLGSFELSPDYVDLGEDDNILTTDLEKYSIAVGKNFVCGGRKGKKGGVCSQVQQNDNVFLGFLFYFYYNMGILIILTLKTTSF